LEREVVPTGKTYSQNKFSCILGAKIREIVPRETGKSQKKHPVPRETLSAYLYKKTRARAPQRTVKVLGRKIAGRPSYSFSTFEKRSTRARLSLGRPPKQKTNIRGTGEKRKIRSLKGGRSSVWENCGSRNGRRLD